MAVAADASKLLHTILLSVGHQQKTQMFFSAELRGVLVTSSAVGFVVSMIAVSAVFAYLLR